MGEKRRGVGKGSKWMEETRKRLKKGKDGWLKGEESGRREKMRGRNEKGV